MSLSGLNLNAKLYKKGYYLQELIELTRDSSRYQWIWINNMSWLRKTIKLSEKWTCLYRTGKWCLWVFILDIYGHCSWVLTLDTYGHCSWVLMLDIFRHHVGSYPFVVQSWSGRSWLSGPWLSLDGMRPMWLTRVVILSSPLLNLVFKL